MHLQGMVEELNADHEYHHDSSTGVLSYCPAAGTQLNETVYVVRPRLQRLVEFISDASEKREKGVDKAGNAAADDDSWDLHFTGFTLAHASPTFFSDYEVVSGGDWSLHRSAAVHFENCSGVEVRLSVHASLLVNVTQPAKS